MPMLSLAQTQDARTGEMSYFLLDDLRRDEGV